MSASYPLFSYSVAVVVILGLLAAYHMGDTYFSSGISLVTRLQIFSISTLAVTPKFWVPDYIPIF